MPESIVKRYYEELGKGKLIAKKCKTCEGYTFPPTTACEHCGKTDLEWVVLSGRGKLLFVSNGVVPPPNPRFDELAPTTYGHVQLEEGPYISAIINGVKPDPEELQNIYNRGPIDVVSDIIKVKELNVLAFKLAEE